MEGGRVVAVKRACGRGKRTISSRWYGDCGVVDAPVTGEERIGFFLLGRVMVVIINVLAAHFAGEEKNGIFFVE
jgi:hypothetical protein